MVNQLIKNTKTTKTTKTTKNVKKVAKVVIRPIINKYKHKTTMAVLNKKGNAVIRKYNIFSSAHLRELKNLPKEIQSDIIKEYNKDIRKLDKLKDIQELEKKKRLEEDENDKKRRDLEKRRIDVMDRKKRFLVKTTVLVSLETTNGKETKYRKL
jgi:hypothetical protein